jgi:hypothetical protein
VGFRYIGQIGERLITAKPCGRGVVALGLGQGLGWGEVLRIEICILRPGNENRYCEAGLPPLSNGYLLASCKQRSSCGILLNTLICNLERSPTCKQGLPMIRLARHHGLAHLRGLRSACGLLLQRRCRQEAALVVRVTRVLVFGTAARPPRAQGEDRRFVRRSGGGSRTRSGEECSADPWRL